MQSKKGKNLPLTLVLLCSLAKSLVPLESTAQTPMSISGVSDANLSKEEVLSLSKAADLGDGAAAFRLYFYYQIVKNDFKTAFIWLKRSANLNNPTAQYNLSYDYQNNSEVKNEKLAKFWLRKAAENGSEEAKKELMK